MSEWETTTLGDIATDFLSGGTPTTKRADYWNGEIPWITSKWLGEKMELTDGEKFVSDEAVKNSSTKIVPENSIIFATRVGVGKVGINRIALAINQDLAGILIDREKYDIRFLAYQLVIDSVQKYVAMNKRGATIKGITRDCLERIRLKIPPLPEQKKIAYILSTVQRAIEAQERIIQTTTELKKALMHKLFTEGLRNEPQKQTEIGLVPKSWTSIRLGELCEKPCGALQTGPFGSQLHKDEYQEEGIAVVNPTHLAGNMINHENLPRVSEEVARRLSKHQLQKFDILLARRGEIGRQGFVTEREEGWICGTGCFLVRASKPFMDNRFLSLYLATEPLVKWLYSHAAGAIMPNLNNTVMRRLPVFYPDLDTQIEIINVISSLSNKTKAASRKRVIIQDLFRTLLHELMTAKRRVHDLDIPIFSSGVKMAREAMP
ncbi:MAG: restriction endonuclease subunit S [Chromatiaceae bacterium]|nr:restriction endonuclease subunit S [Chromatiaceae bacterium]